MLNDFIERYFKIKIINKQKTNQYYNHIENKQFNNCSNIQNEYLPYKKSQLLTKYEYYFYKMLLKKCMPINLLICPKVRLEDFIEVTDKQNTLKYRGKIKSRHIDFTICDFDMNILFCIELDDITHTYKKQIEADNFKNQLFNQIGIPLYRIDKKYGDIEKQIDNVINIYLNQKNATLRQL